MQVHRRVAAERHLRRAMYLARPIQRTMWIGERMSHVVKMWHRYAVRTRTWLELISLYISNKHAWTLACLATRFATSAITIKALCPSTLGPCLGWRRL